VPFPAQLCQDRAGFRFFSEFQARLSRWWLEHVTIDMSNTHWFDADMCALLGALLYRLEQNINTVHLTGIRSEIKTILAKNGFPCQFR